MRTINAGGIASTVLAQVRRIKTRTWVLIGVAFMFSLALAAWAVIALLGALWGGAQTLIGTAPSALEAAKQQVAQHAGALSTAAKEQLAQTVPQVPLSVEQVKAELAKKADALTQDARDTLAQSVPDVSGAIDQASQVGTQTVAAATALAAAAGIALKELPVLPAEALPARDVSGEDLGPARFQGLARVAWSNAEAGASVRYEGRADYVDVLKHYQREFSALGYKQSVLSATPQQETLRFSKSGDVLIVKIERKSPLVSVEILNEARSG